MYDFELPCAVVRGLAREGKLVVAVRSPLHALTRDDGPVAPATVTPVQLETLTLLANPTAAVRVRAIAPATSTPTAALQFVRDEHASGYAREGDTLHLGLRRPLARLAADLAAAAGYSGPLAGQHYQLWPSIVDTLTVLWHPVGSGAALDPADLAAAFPERSLDERRAVLEQLVAHGALVGDGGVYAIRPAIRPWLDLLWSGQALQLEYLRLRVGVPLDDALATTGDTLLFVGPEGQRVRSQQITGADLVALTGDDPPEPEIIRLSAPTPDKLDLALARLLRMR